MIIGLVISVVFFLLSGLFWLGLNYGDTKKDPTKDPVVTAYNSLAGLFGCYILMVGFFISGIISLVVTVILHIISIL